MIKNHNPLPLTPFYFIRHGETDWNQRNIIMGSIDIPLNEVGLKQAQEAAEILKEESFDIIISSPRIRARQTAEIIAKKAHRQILLEQDLAERIWGEAEGKPVDPTKSSFDDKDTPPGAETFSAFQRRVMEAVSSLLLIGKLPLIVSHGGVFKALTHSFGYESLSSANCTPFLFRPPEEAEHSWVVCSLGEDDM
jgi:broad specificity phosphatase PhoE